MEQRGGKNKEQWRGPMVNHDIMGFIMVKNKD